MAQIVKYQKRTHWRQSYTIARRCKNVRKHHIKNVKNVKSHTKKKQKKIFVCKRWIKDVNVNYVQPHV